MKLRRRHPELYAADPAPSRFQLEELRREADVLEHERDAKIGEALRLAEDKDRLAEEVAVVTANLKQAQAAIEAVRNVLRSTSYFAGTRVPDVVQGVDLLARVCEGWEHREVRRG